MQPLVPAAAAPIADRQALEAFVVQNEDLEQLETLLDRFNLFEATGAVRSELRHSAFLAFLLDPSQNHGLGDAFLKRFLQTAISRAEDMEMGISLVDLDVWELAETQVEREWQNIDILCRNNVHKIVVAIENKIGTSEHSDQLRRYREIVERLYPGYQRILLFLGPDGSPASDADEANRWIPLDYAAVHAVVEKLLALRSSTLGGDVLTTLKHYVEMLRRHIMTESEIADLARRIYAKHRRALEIIFEHRPDFQEELAEQLKQLVSKQNLLVLDKCSKAYIRFAPKAWDEIPSLTEGHGWTSTGRILLFEFRNYESLKLHLLIGPGPEPIRQRLFAISQEKPAVFLGGSKSFYQKFHTMWIKSFLNKKDLQDAPETKDTILQNISEKWEQFITRDLPNLTNEINTSSLGATP